jgi:glycosyltransferase involved in cell wall biosynthesis
MHDERDSAQGISEKTNQAAISIVLPIYNEEENIARIADELAGIMPMLPQPVEIIAVDDGSLDGTAQELRKLVKRFSNFKLVRLCRNYGQTAAIMAGVDFSSGTIIITMDADLQNDPKDIPLLLAEIDITGCDVVSGWRVNRQDNPISRVLASRIANILISWISGVHLHDYGCTLKAYRREIIGNLRLYGEMHRFIPVYAAWIGAKVNEIPVNHRVREFGRSKYGLERTLKVLLDLIVLKFFSNYFVKPIYVFGAAGILSFMVSIIILMVMLYLKFVMGYSMILTPLPVISCMFFTVGIICIFMGIIAEIMMRTYFESQGIRPYLIAEQLSSDCEKI